MTFQLLPTDPPWLAKAASYLGFHETGNNQGIDEFVRLSGVGAVGEPWCAIFAGAMLKATGHANSGSAMARSYEHSACVTRLPAPKRGCIVTMWRGSQSSGTGHVTFYVGSETNGRIDCLGGNQGSGVVSVEAFSTDHVTGYWWPAGADASAQPDDTHQLIALGAQGALVLDLQHRLGVIEDGDFGQSTDWTVRGYQSTHGLDDDGEVGPLTWASLLGTTQTQPSQPTPLGAWASGKGSWYSQFPTSAGSKYGWSDSGDKPGSNALGVPDSCQGISFYDHSTLGAWFELKAPNGVVSIEQQTEIGPAPWTGRAIDISAVCAERLGYAPKNFPTDAPFSWARINPPAEVAGLSPQQQASKYYQLRKGAPMPKQPDPPAPPPTKPIQPPAPAIDLAAFAAEIANAQQLIKDLAAGMSKTPATQSPAVTVPAPAPLPAPPPPGGATMGLPDVGVLGLLTTLATHFAEVAPLIGPAASPAAQIVGALSLFMVGSGFMAKVGPTLGAVFSGVAGFLAKLPPPQPPSK